MSEIPLQMSKGLTDTDFLEQELKPGEKSVFERNLVAENVKWKDIVVNQKSFSTLLQHNRNFSGNVLAYVTPVS